MEDKEKIIRQQAAYIRELELERDRLTARAERAESENRKLYARGLWQRVLNMIPE